ncbi:MAG: hypothetical protein II224_01150, partial [Ruminococcus sp.]|nr:hypothetical protein [Ruminococcus sp.]
SLGGVAAASYSDSHADTICGSVLLASYPSGKMSDHAPPVLSVYGTRDGVMDPDKFREAQPYLPPFSVTEQISGGNHAGFGDTAHRTATAKRRSPPTNSRSRPPRWCSRGYSCCSRRCWEV